jgi:YhcH/YjgK/YiaL family protein
MIYDKIENWPLYFKNRKVFKHIFERLSLVDAETENSDCHWKGPGWYMRVMEYDTKPDADIIESHSEFVDIQILISGYERIKMYHFKDLDWKGEYDWDTDVQLYEATGEPYMDLILKPGYMAVFFPDDPHHPQFKVKEPEKLKKVVVKVKVEHFMK